MGLLDDLSGFIKTPEGQGLLSMVAGGMAGSRRGQPWNTAGIAGISGLRGYEQAQENAVMQPIREMQLNKMKADQATLLQKQKGMEALIADPAIPQHIKAGVQAGVIDMGDLYKPQKLGPEDSLISPYAAMTGGNPNIITGAGKVPKINETDIHLGGGQWQTYTTKDGVPDLSSPRGVPFNKKPSASSVSVAGATYEPQFNKELAGLDAKQLDSYRTKADAARGMLTTANKLEQLNPNVYTQGGAEAKLATVNFLQGMGIDVGDPKKVADSQQFESMTTRMVLDSLGGSLGAGVSNADVAFIKNTVPQLGHSMKARTELINFLRNKATNSIKTYDSARTYAEDPANRGLRGWKPERAVVRTGKYDGRNVIEYDDGSIEYGK